MGVLRILGAVLDHFEALVEVVQSTAEVGFPPRFVGGEFVYLTTCHCPRL